MKTIYGSEARDARDALPMAAKQRRPHGAKFFGLQATQIAANFVDIGGGSVRCRYCGPPKTGPLMADPMGLSRHVKGRKHLAAVAVAERSRR